MRGVTLAKQATRVPSPWDSSSFVQLKPWGWQSRESPGESPHLRGFPHPQWKVVFNLPEYLLILIACKKKKKKKSPLFLLSYQNALVDSHQIPLISCWQGAE